MILAEKNFSTTLQICWMCNASKGAADISMVFTDTRENARWRTTYYQDKPWDLEPPYGQLIGFDLKMVVGDLLHVYNLGIARDVIGCSLKTIIKDNVVFHAGDINERFRAATLSLRDFARAHGHSLKLKKLTKNKIQWESKKYPEFKGSGSDAHVTSIWLESVITPFADQYSDLLTLLWSTNHAMRLLYNGDRFLSMPERQTVRVLGKVFQQTYMRLANEALAQHQLMWRVKPKTHLYDHLCECRFARNPSYYSTWMDEDWLKKVSKSMKLVSSKTAQNRVLERWLLSIPVNLKKMMAETPPS